MNFEKFTIKAQEAIAAAQQVAQEKNHQQLDSEHLLVALVRQEDSLIPQLLQKLGVAIPQLVSDLDRELGRRARVTGAAQVYPTQDLQNVFAVAVKEAGKLKDEYVSTEHLLLGLIESGGTGLRGVLGKHGLSRDRVLKALVEVRGNQRVTDQNPEGKFQALEKYGRDLTALARQGKIDPVIGRDDEIRRVMQVRLWLEDPSVKKLLPQLRKLPATPTLYSQVTEELRSPTASLDTVAHLIAPRCGRRVSHRRVVDGL